MDSDEFELPLCLFPATLYSDYTNKVKNFYESGGRKKLEEFSKSMEKRFGLELKALHWDKDRGLTNISLASSGLDLNEVGSRYTFHNIENMESPHTKLVFEIAKRYIQYLQE